MKLSVQEMIKKLKKHKIVVVMGGLSAERAISLLTGQAMVKALKACNLDVKALDIKKRSDVTKLLKHQPDVVVNGLHGPGGEDGAIQGLLDWMGIPYTGSGLLASALAMDKHQAKMLMNANNIPTAPWVLLSKPIATLPKSLSYPVVVKPNQQGSAIGITIAHNQQAFKQALVQANQYSSGVLVEQYIAGTEVSVGVLGSMALPIIEIIPKKEFYDYEAKYVAGMSDHIIPARIKANKTKELQQLAIRVAKAFGCSGTPRVDMIIGPKGKVVVLEVNTLPGMTATSLLPEAAAQAGISFKAVILYNILESLENK